MKKTLALILSLLLAFSCFTVCMATPVSAATTGTNLLADYTVYDWTFAPDRLIADRVTHDPEPAPHGGYIFGARSVGWRGFYTTFPVIANQEYTLSFSVKSMYEFEAARIGVASGFTYDASSNKLTNVNQGDAVAELSYLNSKLYTANGSFKDDGEWMDVSYTFTPTESTDYALTFGFKDKPTGSSASTDTTINPYYFAISDLSLTTPVTSEPEVDNTNLFADKTVSDWLSLASDNRVLNNATETTVSKNGGYAFMSTSVHYQAMRLLFSVKANTDYVLTFSVKSSADWEGLGVFDATGLAFTEGGGKNYTISDKFNSAALASLKANNLSATVDGVDNLAGVESAAWTDISIEFTPTADSDAYVLYMSWANDLGYNDVIVSDLCLTAYGAVPTSVEGNGKVNTEPSVANFGDAVTYTAIAYPDETFIGWYVNGVQVSTETIYNGFVGIDVPVAKFTTNNPLANKTVSDWLSLESDNRVLNNAAETTVSRYGGYAFMSTSVHYQAMRLLFSVKANTDYVLTFSVKSSADWEGLGVFDATGLAFTEGGGKNYTISDKFNSAALASLKANNLSATVDGVDNLAGVESAAWTDISIEFTPTADSDAYVLYMSWANDLGYNDVIVSDLKLVSNTTVNVTANVSGNGAVKAEPATVSVGEGATLTATAYQNDRFIGWYDGDVLVSTEKTYIVDAVYGALDITAKFTGNNLLADITADAWFDNTSAGYEGVDIVVDDATAESLNGGTAIKFTSSSAYRGTHLDLPALAAGTYKLQLNVYHTAGSTLSNISVVGNAVYSVPTTHPDPTGQQANVYGGWQNLCSGVATTEAGWVTYSKVITIEDGIDYDLYIDCAGGCNGTIFSDFSFVKYAEEADSLYTAYNNMLAIRGANSAEGIASGARIYNQISKEWIATNNIVEFGVLAIRTERLGSGDLTLNTSGVSTSIAWTSAGDESSFKLWAETDTTYEFTAVLINIAPKHFDDSYTMTTYAKDANGNVYYGDDQELSMYQSIYSVLSADPENETALELASYGTERGDTTYEEWKTAWES